MTDEFRARMEQQIAAADRRFLADYEKAQREADKNPTQNSISAAEKLEFWAELFKVLYAAWGTRIKYSQPQLAKLCPRCKIGRKGKARKDFERLVREGIEALRMYGYPILSTTNFSKKLLSIPPDEDAEQLAALKAKIHGLGYWIARSDDEIVKYQVRTRPEALRSARTRLANKRQEYRNLGVADAVLDEAIEAIDFAIQQAVAANVVKFKDFARVVKRERQTPQVESL